MKISLFSRRRHYRTNSNDSGKIPCFTSQVLAKTRRSYATLSTDPWIKQRIRPQSCVNRNHKVVVLEKTISRCETMIKMIDLLSDSKRDFKITSKETIDIKEFNDKGIFFKNSVMISWTVLQTHYELLYNNLRLMINCLINEHNTLFLRRGPRLIKDVPTNRLLKSSLLLYEKENLNIQLIVEVYLTRISNNIHTFTSRTFSLIVMELLSLLLTYDDVILMSDVSMLDGETLQDYLIKTEIGGYDVFKLNVDNKICSLLSKLEDENLSQFMQSLDETD